MRDLKISSCHFLPGLHPNSEAASFSSQYFITWPSSLEMGGGDANGGILQPVVQWIIVKWGIEKVLVNTGKSKHNSDWHAGFYTSGTLAAWHDWWEVSASLWMLFCLFVHPSGKRTFCFLYQHEWMMTEDFVHLMIPILMRFNTMGSSQWSKAIIKV